MSIFYAAVEDDPLDSGGQVIEGGSCGGVKGEDGKPAILNRGSDGQREQQHQEVEGGSDVTSVSKSAAHEGNTK